MLPYNKKLNPNARALRKTMTPQEKHLWYDFLKRLPCTVKRQYVIEGYIVDFYIATYKTVIEIDGSQHSLPENREKDKKREEILAGWGITVLRYNNQDIDTRFLAVTTDILKKLGLSFSDLKEVF